MCWESGNGDRDVEIQYLWMWPCRDALWDPGLCYQDGISGDFWAVRVLVLLLTWCWCMWLPPAARESTAWLGQNSQKFLMTLQPQGVGTWEPPRTGRFIGTGGIFHALEQVSLGLLGISSASSFYIPFSIPALWLLPKGPPVSALPSDPKPEVRP